MKKTLVLLLSGLLLLTTLSGCVNPDMLGKLPGSNAGAPTEKNPAFGEFPSALKAQKIGSIAATVLDTSGEGGVVYEDETGKYGILTLDGKKDTGAIYTICEPIGKYFQVMTVDENSIADVASLNCVGVVDALGKEIIPMQYASIKDINERFFRVCEVTEETENKDDALVYYTDKMFSFTASDDDTFFKGNWYIYDVVSGALVPGATGTQAYNVYANDSLVEYVTDAEEQITVNEKGEKVPEGADVFENGCYALETGNTGSVYASDHSKLFDYAPDGFVPSGSEGDYFVASKYADSSFAYVLMDAKGKVVSAEFTDRPSVYGDLLLVDDTVCNFEGQPVIEGSFDYVYFDEQFGGAWFLKSGDKYTLIKKDGTVVFEGTEDDALSFHCYGDFSIEKEIGDKSMFYSFADKDFTVEGYSFAPWLIKAKKPNYVYDIVDSISGTPIITNYKNYSYVAVPGSAIYVYALAENGTDIYLVK